MGGQVPKENRGARSPGAGVTNSCEVTDMHAEIQT